MVGVFLLFVYLFVCSLYGMAYVMFCRLSNVKYFFKQIFQAYSCFDITWPALSGTKAALM